MRIATLILALLSLLMGCGGNGSSHANKSDSPPSSSGGANAESVAILSELEFIFDEYGQMKPKPATGDKFFEKAMKFWGKQVALTGIVLRTSKEFVDMQVGNIKARLMAPLLLTEGTTIKVYGEIIGEDYAGRAVLISVERIEVSPEN